MPADLTNRRGAVYLPAWAYNAYQTWWRYDRRGVERDLDFAARLGLDLLRVFCSYEFWREQAEDDVEGNAHLARLSHLLDAAAARGIAVLPVLFEPIGDEPTRANLRNRDPETSFAVHSPSHRAVIRPRNWSGYVGSPRHFATRVATHLRGHPAVAAVEAMNEPGTPAEAPRRHAFVVDVLRAVREADPDRRLTVGSRLAEHNLAYDDPPLDIHQYHDNLPEDEAAFRDRARRARELAGDRPVWLTEWQRLRTEPPSRFAPCYRSLAPAVHDLRDAGVLDGDCFWSLLCRPAYMEGPRRAGRVNGVFHASGAVYSLADAEAIARRPLDLEEDPELPSSVGDAT